ncbi:MAG: oligosaccharide flippase family protein [Roseivirga sp.]|nr:oligosaccharide flippase family protein [Roseivirga sp.]
MNNTSWVFFANIYRVFLVFVRSIIVAKALSASTFGQYVTILALTASLQAFFNLNIGTMFTKFGASYMMEKRNDKLFGLLKLSFLLTVLSLLVSVILLFFFIRFSYQLFIDQPNLEYHILLLAVAQGMTFIDYTSLSLLRLFYRFRQNSLITMLIITIELVVIIISLVVYSVDLETFLVIIIIQKFASSIIFNGLCFWEIRAELTGFRQAQIKLIKSDFKEIKSFITVNYGSRLVKTLIQQGDVLLLSAFATDYEVGIFGVGKRLGNAILSITDPLMNAVFPQISRMISGKQYKDLIAMIKQITSTVLLLGGAFLIALFFFRFDILALAYGNEFRDGGNVFFVISLSSVAGGIFFWYTSLLLNLELVVYRFKMYIALLVGSLVLGLLIIPLYGAIGAAVTVLIMRLAEVGAGAYKGLHTLNSRL